MKLLSTANQQKILAAVTEAADNISGGDEPNLAIAKAATAVGLGRGFVDLAVRAYNTGRTTQQLKQGKDTLEKIADFPVATTERVLEIMFPASEHVKAASTRLREAETVDSVYAYSPAGHLARSKAAAVAEPIQLVDKKPEAYPGDPILPYRKLANEAAKAAREAENARRVSSELFDKLASLFGDLDACFRQPTSVSVDTVTKCASLYFGAPAESVLQTYQLLHPNTAALIKSAGDVSSQRATDRPYVLVQELIKVARAADAAKLDYEMAENRRQQAYAAVQRYGAVETTSALFDPPAEKVASILDSTWKSLMSVGAMKNLMNPGQLTPGAQPIERLADPEHEVQLRKIRATAMLSDLIQNDPVISSHPDDEVLTAFNEISQVAPAASDSPMAMQTLLRQRLQQGGVAAFDVNQMANISKGISEATGRNPLLSNTAENKPEPAQI